LIGVERRGTKARSTQIAADGVPALEVSGARKSFGTVQAVAGIDVSLRAGEFVTLLGPSGCGKSTLLRMIAGIEVPTAGTIAIAGRSVSDPTAKIDVPPERRNIGMVFQSYAVWPHMSVGGNIEYPLKRARLPSEERKRRVADVMATVRLTGLGGRFPGQLSGGQQQRVALARAIVARPALLLLDEPLSNLDAQLRDEMRIELKRLQIDLGLTMLYVTHDQAEALALSDRVLVISDGRLIQEGSPEEVYRSPATIDVARFLGAKNIVHGKITGAGELLIANQKLNNITFPDDSWRPGDDVKLALRPGDLVRAAEDESAVVARIEVVEFLGTSYDHQVSLEDGTAIVVNNADCLGARGEPVRLKPKEPQLLVYGLTSADP
jgi:ABC-type Fe3+/spermidine/putrescine transport system ATPase subunit